MQLLYTCDIFIFVVALEGRNAVNCRVHHPTLGHWRAGIKERREREREVDRKHVNKHVDRHIET